MIDLTEEDRPKMSRETQTARIHRQPKSAMQSGRAGAGEWRLDFEPGEPKRLDPMTGWAGSGDTNAQVKLRFPTLEAAVAYAESRGLRYQIEQPAPVKSGIKPKVYADNFKFGRTENWSH